MKRASLSWSLTNIFCLSALLVLLLPTTSCDDKNPTGPHPGSSDPIGTLVATTGCKQPQPPAELPVPAPNQDCVEYEYDGKSVLKLKHVNAGFNCCPKEITADIEIEDKKITIVEHEADYGCRCLCLFDVDYKIKNLEPGEYEIKVVELYTGEGDEPLEFKVDLSQAGSGIHCVERDHYPW